MLLLTLAILAAPADSAVVHDLTVGAGETLRAARHRASFRAIAARWRLRIGRPQAAGG